MTIAPYGSASRYVQNSSELFRGLKTTLGTLQTQLASGKTADTVAGLGSGGATSLHLNARLSTLDGYSISVADAGLRVSLASAGLQHIADVASDLGSTLVSGPRASVASRNGGQLAASADLAEAIDALNTVVNGRYLFSGRAADTEPVVSSALLLDGDSSHAGLKQLVAERKAADLGASGTGRLTLGSAGSTVTLAEEAAGLPFGFKIAGARPAAGPGVTATQSAGPPASVLVNVAAQPSPGDTVAIDLVLPDGSQQTITLTAATGATPTGEGPFTIGATPADTAANLQAALGTAIRGAATTTLSSASALKASTDFFAGSATTPPPRVAGPPFDSATALVAGTPANTVIWYRGDDGAGSARETAPVQIGDHQSVAIGLRANEPGLRNVLAAFAAIAADSFAESDATSADRYDALSSRVASQLLGDGGVTALNAVTTDLARASFTIGSAVQRISTETAQVKGAVDAIETVKPEQAAAELLATQTRLQASYQVTSAIAKLSLADYL